jgi:hypothetical protein
LGRVTIDSRIIYVKHALLEIRVYI